MSAAFRRLARPYYLSRFAIHMDKTGCTVVATHRALSAGFTRESLGPFASYDNASVAANILDAVLDEATESPSSP